MRVSTFVIAATTLLISANASAQLSEEPTQGVELPGIWLAGEHDAFAVSANPAGLSFLDASYLGFALNLHEGERTTSPGEGGGVYWGAPLFKNFGIGFAAEWLRPERAYFSPDPGTPLRLSLASSIPLGPKLAFGAAWRRFFDEDQPNLGGSSTWDLGLSARINPYLAFGATLRDAGTPMLDELRIQRRYEAELVTRPLGTEQLQLGIGGRFGETRVAFGDATDLDGWFRYSWRVKQGLFLRGQVESRSLQIITPGLPDAQTSREIRGSVGLEISFGNIGLAAYASGINGDTSNSGFSSAALLGRISGESIPSVIAPTKWVEKIALKDAIGQRKATIIGAKLRKIARSPHVVGLLLHIDNFAAGWSTTHELRSEIERVKKAGKKVVAYISSASTRDYFLASVADKIYMDPAGIFMVTGFAGTSMYYKRMFDLIGVKAEFEKIEEFKSAPEAWTRTGPSEAALMARNAIYDSLYTQIVASIAEGRKLSRERVMEIIDKGPYTPGDFTNKEIVDAVMEPDEFSKELSRLMGGFPLGSAAKEREDRWERPEIAIIYVDGDIVGGKSRQLPILGRKLVGGETIAKAIASARENPKISAIVLRINSPGGNAVASEVMSREVFKTRGKKPIICSMGDYAASGGYFAAAGCDHIFAGPMTITGSIGIFNGKFDLSSMLRKSGIDFKTYKRGARSDITSMYRSITDEERKVVKEKIRYYYERFIGAVAKGRGMSVEEVDKVGRGRVWTGAMAKGIQLVDSYGSLSDAIQEAKRRAGLGKGELATLRLLPEPSGGLLSRLLGGGLFGSINSGGGESEGAQGSRYSPGVAMLKQLGEAAAALGLLDALPMSFIVEPQAYQARIPFGIILN